MKITIIIILLIPGIYPIKIKNIYFLSLDQTLSKPVSDEGDGEDQEYADISEGDNDLDEETFDSVTFGNGNDPINDDSYDHFESDQYDDPDDAELNDFIPHDNSDDILDDDDDNDYDKFDYNVDELDESEDYDELYSLFSIPIAGVISGVLVYIFKKYKNRILTRLLTRLFDWIDGADVENNLPSTTSTSADTTLVKTRLYDHG